MKPLKRNLTVVASGALLLGAILAAAGPIRAQQHFDAEPAHFSGQGVTPAFEGWFRNADGTYSILAGYYNRNLRETVDIPIGPDNDIEPGGPDLGQPTHFLPGRGWGPFSITVPKDFGDKELTWTITVNGFTNKIPLNIRTLWEISPFIDAINNTPPWLSFQPFDEGGPRIQGPKPIVITRTAKVGVPLPMTAYVSDDVVYSPGREAPKTPITTSWSLMRGPEGGEIKFDPPRPTVEKVEVQKMPEKSVYAGKVSTTATFSAAGEYTVYLAVNDASGNGGGNGFQCCWTNAHIKVTVAK